MHYDVLHGLVVSVGVMWVTLAVCMGRLKDAHVLAHAIVCVGRAAAARQPAFHRWQQDSLQLFRGDADDSPVVDQFVDHVVRNVLGIDGARK